VTSQTSGGTATVPRTTANPSAPSVVTSRPTAPRPFVAENFSSRAFQRKAARIHSGFLRQSNTRSTRTVSSSTL
jgi:hypothetical protein